MSFSVSENVWYDPPGPKIKLEPDPDRPGGFIAAVPAKMVKRTVIRSIEPWVVETFWELIP
jgi:hypothetical protein